MKTIKTICLLLLVAMAGKSMAQKPVDDLYADFSVPDLSAYTLLGINSNAVNRPGNVKEFAAGMLTMVSAVPNIYPGIAFEYAPAYTRLRNLEKKIATLNAGQRSFVDGFYKRPEKNFQLSFGSGVDSLGGNLAFGVKWSYDWGDKNMDDCYLATLIGKYPAYSDVLQKHRKEVVVPFLEEFVADSLAAKRMSMEIMYYLSAGNSLSNSAAQIDSIKTVFVKAGIPVTAEVTEGIPRIVKEYYSYLGDITKLEGEVADFKDAYTKKMWNNKAIAIGVGNIWNAPTNQWGDLHFSRFAWYVSYAQPLLKDKKLRRNPGSDCTKRIKDIMSSNAFGILSVWQLQGNYFYSPADSTSDFMISPGARFIFGHNNFRVSVEGVYTYVTKRSADASHHIRSTLGVEFRIANGLWLEFAMGVQGPTNQLDQSSILSLGNIKYALQSKRRFGL